jgi:hypothetical protein
MRETRTFGSARGAARKGRPYRDRLGSVVRTPAFDGEEAVPIRERRLCQTRRAGARCAGVVRRPVVRIACCAKRDRVVGVVGLKARCASVVPCRCGTLMLAAGQRQLPARPTRRCSRPLRARDRALHIPERMFSKQAVKATVRRFPGC